MRILLLEPDRKLAAVYTRAFERAGHEVAASGHAQHAVMQADEKRPDVVVLEMQLPGHGGVEFLYEFRSYPEWRHIPVILHTLVPRQSLRLQSEILRRLDAETYLYKPAASLRALVSAVEGAALSPA
jgi:CheY-like chemotaxis protein